MTTIAVTTEPKQNQAGMVSIASMIGSAVESYDFFIYGTASAAYFGSVFFHAKEPIVGVLASFATLAIGFLMRPLGGYLAGHYGDRIGRKAVLFWSLIIMGVATVAIGLLPTYAQVGWIAPVLLILLRMIQGVGFGAEWGGAVLMAFEHAPEERRGYYGAVPQLGIPLGLLLANGTFLLSSNFLEGEWIWRAPFLASVIMVVIGTWIRLNVHESPDFEKVKADKAIHRQPATEVLKRDWRLILRIMGLRLAETGGYYITTSFMLSYVALAKITTTQNVLIGTLVGSFLGLFSLVIFGQLSDRIGRKKVFMIGAVFTMLFGIPMFLMINTGSFVMIVTAISLSLLFSHDPIFAVESSWFSEQFPANVRTSGISLGYNGASLIAGVLPFIAIAIYGGFGWIGAALIYIALGVVSLICGGMTPETAPCVRRRIAE
jgi:MFS family permease